MLNGIELPPFELKPFNLYVELIVVLIITIWEIRKVRASKVVKKNLKYINATEFERIARNPKSHNAVIIDAVASLTGQAFFEYEHIKNAKLFSPELLNKNSKMVYIGDETAIYLYGRDKKTVEKIATQIISKSPNRKIYALENTMYQYKGKLEGLLPNEILEQKK